MTDAVDEHLSDEARQYANEHIGEDIDIGAVVVPPVPRDEVENYTGDSFYNPLAGHLYDLTDLALAINHAGDITMSHGVEEPAYSATRDSVAEVKIAHGALISSYNRELAACADYLGIDPDETEDLVQAIRDKLGYSVETEVTEEWTEIEDDTEYLTVDEAADALGIDLDDESA